MKYARLSFHAVLLAVLACTLTACPNPEETFTIRVVKSSDGIDVLSLAISNVGPLGGADVTDNLLLRRIRPGRQRDVTVLLEDVGEGNGIGLVLDGASSSRFAKVVDGGFAAGITVVVTVSGNVRDTNVDVLVQ